MSSKGINLRPPFRALCIDDANRPAEIPIEKWVVVNQEYVVDKVVRTLDNKIGFVINQLNLGDDTFPYDSISPHRFAINMEDVVQMETDQATEELLEELNLTTIDD